MNKVDYNKTTHLYPPAQHAGQLPHPTELLCYNIKYKKYNYLNNEHS